MFQLQVLNSGGTFCSLVIRAVRGFELAAASNIVVVARAEPLLVAGRHPFWR